MATVRAQPAVPLIPAFASGAFVPQEGLDTAVHGMLDQVTAWSEALRGVREARVRGA